ncbi:MAG: hypothetical protein QOE15_2732, partial [Acidimicrobiaceae bacterium]|nr:hypothetical protein [Acidimicrobiaceae bacterium]
MSTQLKRYGARGDDGSGGARVEPGEGRRCPGDPERLDPRPSPSASPQIRRHDGVIRGHHGRRTRGNPATEVQNRHVVTNAEDEFHVVVDEEHR